MADRDRSRRAGADAEGFLRRWSRRKADARSAPAATAAASDDVIPAAEAAPASLQEAHEPDAPVELKDLPDIASLDAGSDFTVFMRPGVPGHLRTLALRKLWQSDPIFSKLDGLVEYGEDYSLASWPKGTIETAYRIGRGFVNELEAEEAEAEPPKPPVGGGPAPEPEPAIAPTDQKRPADFPSEPLEPAPEAAASEARPGPPPVRGSAPGPAGAGAPAKRRRLPARKT
jgi:hypothetical protein